MSVPSFTIFVTISLIIDATCESTLEYRISGGGGGGVRIIGGGG